LFEFQCDDCEETNRGASRNEAILGIRHKKHCESHHGIPIHYTRVNKARDFFICLNCESDNHTDCVGMQNGSYCECHKCYMQIPEN